VAEGRGARRRRHWARGCGSELASTDGAGARRARAKRGEDGLAHPKQPHHLLALAALLGAHALFLLVDRDSLLKRGGPDSKRGECARAGKGGNCEPSKV